MDRRRDPSGIGSPPRMRGKPRRRRFDSPINRITPADAGKTQFLMLAPRRDQDHPRGCGENSLKRHSRDIFPGSPPRMRGKQSKITNAANRDRITPADAGKTLVDAGMQLFMGDHPRGCGENLGRTRSRKATVGSPPRMRGKPTEAADRPESWRITPADAGKTIFESRQAAAE